MNDDRAFERATRDWLEAGSDVTPATTIEAVLLAVRTTPQERDLRIPWRIATMSTPLRLVAAVAIVAIGGFAIASLFKALPIGLSPTPSPTGLASPTTQPTVTPLPSPTQRPTAVPPSGPPRIPHGPLPAGTYTTTVFTPATTVTVADGWMNQSETTDRLILSVGDTFHQVSIARVVGDPLVLARPNADYQIGPTTTTTIAGLPAQESAFVLSATATVRSFYPLSPLPDSSDATLELVRRGTEARLITVDVSGTQVVILVQRPIGDTTDFDTMVGALLASISFK